jgi:hypothetical protein
MEGATIETKNKVFVNRVKNEDNDGFLTIY